MTYLIFQVVRGLYQTCRRTNLNVPDLLPLKLIYGLLQLPGDARGIHGGSLELTFCLLIAESNHQCFVCNRELVNIKKTPKNPSSSSFEFIIKCNDN